MLLISLVSGESCTLWQCLSATILKGKFVHKQTLCGQTAGGLGCRESWGKKEVRGSERKWEECVWVWDCRPIEGSNWCFD